MTNCFLSNINSFMLSPSSETVNAVTKRSLVWLYFDGIGRWFVPKITSQIRIGRSLCVCSATVVLAAYTVATAVFVYIYSGNEHGNVCFRHWPSGHCFYNHKFESCHSILSVCVCASHLAPSPVTVIRKEKTSRNSVSLSWVEPERPNGIILDYEIKYYEKVGCWIYHCCPVSCERHLLIMTVFN